MGRDRRCCWERPGKLMWRPAASRPECFLFKVIKSSDHRESGSHRSADERKMKYKHEARQQRLMCTSRNPFSCVLQGGTRRDLSGEIFIKVHLLYGRFRSLDPNTPSIHKEKHTPLYLYWLLQMRLSNEMWWKALSDNNRRPRGDLVKKLFFNTVFPRLVAGQL